MSSTPDGSAVEPIGHRRWAIAEGYIPAYGTGPEPQFTSHETACLLNAGDRDAHVTITVYFTDREPQGPTDWWCRPAARTTSGSTTSNRRSRAIPTTRA